MDLDNVPICPNMLSPRAYQLEMLEESLKRNIVIAMDTGSGKTNIAILRIAAEIERTGLSKRVWFLCPTVTLAQQQYSVISGQLPAFQSRILTGKDGVDSWSSQTLWDEALRNISIVVCTPQILLDALIHGFVKLSFISLLVFDEAHHCQAGHAANRIMQDFYVPQMNTKPTELPHILGLTASPAMKERDVELKTIEKNLNAICRTPKLHRDELFKFVHFPKLIPVLYKSEQIGKHPATSGIADMYNFLLSNPGLDPYVCWSSSNGDPNEKVLRKALSGRTYCQQQAKKLLLKSNDVHAELGCWASAFYLKLCVSRFHDRQKYPNEAMNDLMELENQYLDVNLSRFIPTEGIETEPLGHQLSFKANLLVETLREEMSNGNIGIVFVRTRATVRLLQYILMTDIRTRDMLRVGTFVGNSSYQKRSNDICNLLDMNDQEETLDDLRTGRKNLILSTSVLEEGIDVTACNIVVCFDAPANLKSFIQRRGRARSAFSKYMIMLPESEASRLADWTALEQHMKDLYMDDMRKIHDIEALEREETGHKEFCVKSTGAKLSMDQALRHLFHFCSTLPSNGYTSSKPIFSFSDDNGRIRGKVFLPNSVDTSVREFTSAETWKTERLARQDAAFEAYLGLYKSGLINDNLLPVRFIDEEVQQAYDALEKRPNILQVGGQLDPWIEIAEAWIRGEVIYNHSLTIRDSEVSAINMQLACPESLDISDLTLYIDASTTANVFIRKFGEFDKGCISSAADIMLLIMKTGLISRMDSKNKDFPVICIPKEAAASQRSWLEQATGTDEVTYLLAKNQSSIHEGLVKDRTQNGVLFQSFGIERGSTMESDSKNEICLRIKARRFPKKRNFLNKVNLQEAKNRKDLVMNLLEPSTCSALRIPIQYAWFSILFPSILDHINNYLIAQRLCDTVLVHVGFHSIETVQKAITASSVNDHFDYQRLEFFGDSLLKFRTSLVLIATHSTWHEGVLSHAKDHIVSNGNLAVAALKAGLDKFILSRSFTYQGWRMPYLRDILERPQVSSRELSTKVLADVVESLLGAAFLDGGESMLQKCLATILPKVPWVSPDGCFTRLFATSNALFIDAIPDQYKPLGILIGHDFTCSGLLIESITHSSYLSTSKISSYERLEFLGDAILDNIVTKMIFGHSSDIPVSKMHSLRSAAVNANLLAYLAMSLTVPVPHAEILPPQEDKSPNVVPSVKHLSLPMFLRAAPIPQLKMQMQKTFQRFNKLRSSISMQLKEGTKYPWADLCSIGAPKLMSDLIESTLGAIAIDSRGDMEACERWLDKLGILPWLRQAMDRHTINLLHPKEGLGIAAVDESVEYKITTNRVKFLESETPFGDVNYTCEVYVGGNRICEACDINPIAAETRAADKALEVLVKERLGNVAVSTTELDNATPDGDENASLANDSDFDTPEEYFDAALELSL